jgi:hypothetical protein
MHWPRLPIEIGGSQTMVLNGAFKFLTQGMSDFSSLSLFVTELRFIQP